MVPFAGYDMPFSMKGSRPSISLFVKRPGSLTFPIWANSSSDRVRRLSSWVTSNDVDRLVPGKVQYSCLPNETGGIVDDLLVYCLSDQDSCWWSMHRTSKGLGLVASVDGLIRCGIGRPSKNGVCWRTGPKSRRDDAAVDGIPLAEMSYYSFSKGNLAGVSDILISATGYTGAGGFELYVKNEQATGLWKKIRALGAAPAGLGARDTLRLEKAFCLYGNELSDTTSPLEAGLGWITKFKKDFIQKEQLLEQKACGLERKLIGFEMVDRGIPRKGYTVLSDQGEEMGEVTSGTHSPSLEGHRTGLYCRPQPRRLVCR